MSVSIVDRSGVSAPVVVGDPNTKRGTREYVLANNITLNAGARGPLVSNVKARDTYVFFASFQGTSPSLQLQFLGDDGNYYNIDNPRTQNGTGTVAENIGEGTSVCVLNSGANQLTNVYAKLS